MNDFRLRIAAASVPNLRSRPWQDRWAVGQNHRGGWLVLADGISGGRHGDRAAAAAVQVVVGHLASSALDEVAVAAAVDLAQAAVRPWYRRERGGSTLSVATLTPARLVVAALGDSPVLRARQGRDDVRRLTPEVPLRDWVGGDGRAPWLDSWPLVPGDVVLVCSDGAVPADPSAPADDDDPEAWIDALLGTRAARGDDATVLAAVVRSRVRV